MKSLTTSPLLKGGKDMNEEPQKTLTEILAKLHTIHFTYKVDEYLKIMEECSNFDDAFDAGYQEALRECRHIIKDYLLATPPLEEK